MTSVISGDSVFVLAHKLQWSVWYYFRGLCICPCTHTMVCVVLFQGSRDNMSIVIITFEGSPKVSEEALNREAELEARLEAKVQGQSVTNHPLTLQTTVQQTALSCLDHLTFMPEGMLWIGPSSVITHESCWSILLFFIHKSGLPFVLSWSMIVSLLSDQ